MGLTNDEVWEVKHISSDSKAERTRHRLARRLEQHAVRIHGLRTVLERMRGEALPVFYY